MAAPLPLVTLLRSPVILLDRLSFLIIKQVYFTQAVVKTIIKSEFKMQWSKLSLAVLVTVAALLVTAKFMFGGLLEKYKVKLIKNSFLKNVFSRDLLKFHLKIVLKEKLLNNKALLSTHLQIDKNQMWMNKIQMLSMRL